MYEILLFASHMPKKILAELVANRVAEYLKDDSDANYQLVVSACTAISVKPIVDKHGVKAVIDRVKNNDIAKDLFNRVYKPSN